MRDFFHTFISILLWLLFGYYWYVVSGRQISWGTFQALLVLGMISLLGLVITAMWVRHNQNLAHGNRRTGSHPTTTEILEYDHLNRTVIAPPTADLKKAHIISINLDENGNKVYAAPTEVAV